MADMAENGRSSSQAIVTGESPPKSFFNPLKSVIEKASKGQRR